MSKKERNCYNTYKRLLETPDNKDFHYFGDVPYKFQNRFTLLKYLNEKDHPRRWFIQSLTYLMDSYIWERCSQVRTARYIRKQEKLIEKYEQEMKKLMLVYKIAPDTDIANCILDYIPEPVVEIIENYR